MYLKDLPEDESFVEKHDDIEGVFEEVCNEHNIKYPKELVKELIKSCTMLELNGITIDQDHFNLQEIIISSWVIHVMESMKTPSYPSGHSAQGILIGKVLQTKLPITTDSFIELVNVFLIQEI